MAERPHVVKDREHFCPQMTCRAVVPHRWRPSPEAGPHWRCSECGEPNEDLDAWFPGGGEHG